MIRSAMAPALLAGLLLALSAGTAAPALESAPYRSIASRYIALAIQGELRAARALLENHAGQETFLLERYVSRFVENSHAVIPPSGIELADRVVEAYRRYWSDSLLQPPERAQAEAALLENLRSVLAKPHPGDPLEDMETALSGAGLHVLQSPSPPLLDLYVWRDQLTSDFDVQLTDQVIPLSVVFMDDFISLGWKEYASLGLATTTGWVENGRLYCVSWAYDRDSENFRVSYLKHEARHLADLERYPEMDTTELEYRAKLTELAFAQTTVQRILEDFSAKAADNPASPHAMANHRVVRDIGQALSKNSDMHGAETWAGYAPADINRAARSLLEINTHQHASR